MRDGERQVAPTLDGIRRDHVARYEWVLGHLNPQSRVIDAACGIGYGSKILADAGHRVFAFDRDPEAIAYAEEHYAHPLITYAVRDVTRLYNLPPTDAAVSFETIEHLENPLDMLRALRSPNLFASVPNEDHFPFAGYAFHERHYKAGELEQLLQSAGYSVAGWYGQRHTTSDVEALTDPANRTLVVRAQRGNKWVAAPPPYTSVPRAMPPKHVAILGLGPSLEAFVDTTKRLGGISAFCDEVWGINAVGDVVRCDRVFHMDDVRVQERRAEALPQSNIANMLRWMRRHPGPIYTSRIPVEGHLYPGLVEYPLQDVINGTGFAYFNSTAAYAVAFAVYLGVKKISLYGFDFTYASSHVAERGRACVEFWLGIAAARGIEIGTSDKSSLLDSCDGPQAAFYGYDAVDVDVQAVDGAAQVSFRPKPLPTAEEIEARYDHTRHPNTLVGGRTC